MRRYLFLWSLTFVFAGSLWAEGEARSLLVEAQGRRGVLRGELLVIATEGGASYVSLDRLARLLKVRRTWSAKSSTAVFRVAPKTVRLMRDRARVLVQGKPVALARPPRVTPGGWVVPEEFLTGVLPKLYRSIRVTDVRVSPGMEPVRAAVSLADLRLRSYPSFTRVVLESGGSFGYRIRETQGVVRVQLSGLSIPAPRVETVGDGLVRELRLTPAEGGANLQVLLEGAPGETKVMMLEDPHRLVVDIRRGRVTLADLRFRSYPSFTRVVVEGSDTFAFQIEQGQTKIRARLPGLSIPAPRVETVGDGLVRELRLTPAATGGELEVLIEGSRGQIKAMKLEEPYRLVLDIRRPGKSAAIGAQPEPLRRVVLDAGHGGHDAGAVSRRGLREKNVVLDVTKRVARMVKEQLGIDVTLTRTGDYFVALQDRTQFANKMRGQLFVSIHANANRHSGYRGVETYFLSSEASDNEARQVAALENGVVRLESVNSRAKTDVLKTILWDLAQSQFQEESSRLAETVQDSVTRSLGIRNRGVKQAGFYVLGAAAMPAILVEIGFLTNKREERRLSDPGYRERVARAIYAGLAEYKRRYDHKMQPAQTAEVPQ